MSKTIGQQVEEFWSKFHSHSMASAADGDEVTDWLTQTLQERDRIAREEAIKECEEAYQHGLKKALEVTELRCLAYKDNERVLNETREDLQNLLPRADITSDKK